MSNEKTLKQRLESLQERIDAAELRLRLKGIFDKEHKATKDELQARYDMLNDSLEKKIHDAETQGHRVSTLELAVLNWINALETDL